MRPMNGYSGTPSPTTASGQHSPWHSPVPYLFGGLAAMLGLIAFALLILACSYWKLSGYLENNGADSNPDGAGLESGDRKPQPEYEEKVLVIMAGQMKPTFLATPSSGSSVSTTGSCGNGGKESLNNSVIKTSEASGNDDADYREEAKQRIGDPVQGRGMVNSDRIH